MPTVEGNELAALYRLTDRLYRADTLQESFDAALDAIGETLGSSRASILLFDAGKSMRFAAWRGLSPEYREAVDGHTPWRVGELGARPIFTPDILLTDEPAWLKDRLSDEKIRALAFIPLTARGGVIGKFMLYHEEPHIFSAAEHELAVTIARQLGFSVERHRAEEARAAAIVELQLSEERSRMMSEDAPVMIWTSDANGHCRALNKLLREFWNVDADDVANFDWSASIHPEDAATVFHQMQSAMTERRPVTVTARYKRVDGEYRSLQTEARPILGPDGSFGGMIGVNLDVTERNAAENAVRTSERRLRESEGRQRIAASAAGLGIFEWNFKDGTSIWENDRMYEIFGRSRSDGLIPYDDLLSRCLNRDDIGKLEKALLDALPEGQVFQVTCRLRPLEDGTTKYIEISGQVDQDDLGNPQRVVGVVADVTERNLADEHRRLMIDELNHRVKNMLALVKAMARQTFRQEPGVSESLKTFDGRLATLAEAHNLLAQGNWTQADLTDVTRQVFYDNPRISCDGPRVSLQPKQAVTLAMALHELHTNAAKYGALSNDSGRVVCKWALFDQELERLLKVEWQEIGGPAVAPPSRRGFGTVMIDQALRAEFGGEVSMEFKAEGLICVFKAPYRHSGSIQ